MNGDEVVFRKCMDFLIDNRNVEALDSMAIYLGRHTGQGRLSKSKILKHLMQVARERCPSAKDRVLKAHLNELLEHGAINPAPKPLDSVTQEIIRIIGDRKLKGLNTVKGHLLEPLYKSDGIAEKQLQRHLNQLVDARVLRYHPFNGYLVNLPL